ncbi:MAG TPA: alpha/beta fold hydrolase [Nevskiaceae bacterium]|nr:alpha/beta fold hydrolase [Nevskiaceae bacterium]
MRERSLMVRARGLRHHLRIWGEDSAPPLLLLHGFLDVSATFAPLATPLAAAGWRVVAPDFRGFGHSQWPEDGYWFADYVADLEALVRALFGDSAALPVIGHSMGGQVAALYAGLRPSRVSRLAVLDSLFLPDGEAAQAAERYRRWLDALQAPLREQRYPDYPTLAGRIRKTHPQLDERQALFVAQCWARPLAGGGVSLRADPRHRLPFPLLYRAAEAETIWRQVQAPTLFVEARRSPFYQGFPAAQRAARRACFAAAQVVEIEAGHMLHFDAPAATAAAVIDFLRSG